MAFWTKARGLALLLVSAVLAPGKVFAAERIVVEFFDHFPPFSVADANGTMTGPLVEGAKLVGARAGFEIEARGHPWARAQELVQTGAADALVTIPTAERRNYLIFADTPILIDEMLATYRADRPDRAQLDHGVDLKRLGNLLVVDYVGNGWTSLMLAPDVRIRRTPNEDEELKQLADGQGDIAFMSVVALRANLHRLGLENRLTTAHLVPPDPLVFHFGIRRDYPNAADVAARMNRAAREIWPQLQSLGLLQPPN